MRKILAGMVAPEKMGVRGSMWLILDNEVLTITNLKEHQARLEKAKTEECEIEYISQDAAKWIVQAFT